MASPPRLEFQSSLVHNILDDGSLRMSITAPDPRRLLSSLEAEADRLRKELDMPDPFVTLYDQWSDPAAHHQTVRAMEIPGAGVIVQTIHTSDHVASSQALVFVPGVRIDGRRLVPIVPPVIPFNEARK
jgi:hypothetical protein